MAHWRVAVHALDRTGPPILALELVRWILENEPDDSVDIVAFRGGALAESAHRLADLEVLLRDHEPWDAAAPDPERVREMAAQTEQLRRAEVTLLVSVSAGQAIDVLVPRTERVVAWVVEQGEDLHWIDDLPDLVPAVDRWIGGSAGSSDEMARRLAMTSGVETIPEFVAMPDPPGGEAVRHCRRELGAAPEDLLVIGAGIGTHRKAPDLFVEVAARAIRSGLTASRFVWIGGETDDLLPLVKEDVARLRLDNIAFLDSVADVTPWMAAADVFLHPARLDAFPLVCLHAASVGTPVVAFSGAGGVPEMMGDAFCGSPYPDVAALADIVVDLRHASERRSVGDRQRERVRGKYSVDRCAPKVVDVLRRTSAQGPGRVDKP